MLCLVNNKMMSGSFIDFYCCYSTVVLSSSAMKRICSHKEISALPQSPKTYIEDRAHTSYTHITGLKTGCEAQKGYVYLGWVLQILSILHALIHSFTHIGLHRSLLGYCVNFYCTHHNPNPSLNLLPRHCNR